ncbi:ADP-glyceromanno-heptose 6-epimerase [Rickettsiales bacterium]|nr:ADP-glyceromanno-heptose 6-epimerase [Rickettsiales bacterium]
MIIVTGGAGFIGSNLVKFLSDDLKKQVCIVDWFEGKKISNYRKRKSIIKIKPNELKTFLKKNKIKIEIILHMAAITATTETDTKLIIENNIKLSLFLWNWCSKNKVRFLYASSAATYGDGKNGFTDDQSLKNLTKLHPLNLYGWSKHIIDKLFVEQALKGNNPPQWVGLKFFNVFGPNEYHKGSMKSIVVKIFDLLAKNESIKLFKSHNKNFPDGGQLRDFIYVKDVIKVVAWFIKEKKKNGIYNVGTGKARSFKDLALAVLKFSNKEQKISYVETPKAIRNKYQYFTEANTSKLKNSGFPFKFYSLEQGIKDYIINYLSKDDRYI